MPKFLKAARHEVVLLDDKSYIRPRPHTEVETWEPVQQYRESRSARGGKLPPHLDFLRTFHKARFGRSANNKPGRSATEKLGRPTPRTVNALVRHSDRYGLPGTLPHVTDQVWLAPRWEGLPFAPENLAPCQATYVFELGRWQERGVAIREWQELAQPVAGELVRGQENKAEVLLRDLDAPDRPPSTEWLLSTWARHFPEVSEEDRQTHRYPSPGAPEFWAAYAEPLDRFFTAARLLDRALGVEMRPQYGRDNDPVVGVKLGQPDLDLLQHLVDGVRLVPVAEESKGGESRWGSTYGAKSLLGLYAAMAAWDLEELGAPRLCIDETCRAPYFSKFASQEYCSDLCRRRVIQARRETKKRDATRGGGE